MFKNQFGEGIFLLILSSMEKSLQLLIYKHHVMLLEGLNV